MNWEISSSKFEQYYKIKIYHNITCHIYQSTTCNMTSKKHPVETVEIYSKLNNDNYISLKLNIPLFEKL